MNKYIMTQVFRESVDKKDLSGIRTCIAESIYRDPSFKTGSYEALMDYVKSNGVIVTEPYQKRPDEFDLPEDNWDDRFFYRLVEWFRLNFAPDNRVPRLKEVGRKVFVEKATNDKPQSFQPVPEGRRNRSDKPSILLILGAAVAVVALILLVVQLIRH